MNLFERAIKFVLEHEGGFVNDPLDPGGATNAGISLRFLRRAGDVDRNDDGIADFDLDGDGDIDAADVESLTLAQIKALYRENFWDKLDYERLPDFIAIKLFDLSVNMGPRAAHKILQRTLRGFDSDIVVDGIIGPQTLDVLNWVEKKLGPGCLQKEISAAAEVYYVQLTQRRPVLSRYLDGWVRRANAWA